MHISCKSRLINFPKLVEEICGLYMNEDDLSRINYQPLGKPIVLIKDVTTIDDDTLKEEISKNTSKALFFFFSLKVLGNYIKFICVNRV